MSNDLQQLGRVLRQRRIDLDLTQDEIAEALGISRTTVSAIENGSLGQTSTFVDVASSLGLDVLLVPRHSKTGYAAVDAMRIAGESLRRRVSRS